MSIKIKTLAWNFVIIRIMITKLVFTKSFAAKFAVFCSKTNILKFWFQYRPSLLLLYSTTLAAAAVVGGGGVSSHSGCWRPTRHARRAKAQRERDKGRRKATMGEDGRNGSDWSSGITAHIRHTHIFFLPACPYQLEKKNHRCVLGRDGR